MDQSPDSQVTTALLWDKKLRLDHILTWLVTGAATGTIAALLWVQSVDRRLHTVEQEQTYQRERDQKQDAAISDALAAVKEQMRMLRDDVRELSNKLDRRTAK